MAQFNLLTSDGKTIVVDTAFLSVHSVVFKEMFSLPQPDDEGEAHCKLAESSKEITFMIDALKGTYTTCSKRGLRTLVLLADKYEMMGLVTVIRAELWSVASAYSRAPADD